MHLSDRQYISDSFYLQQLAFPKVNLQARGASVATNGDVVFRKPLAHFPDGRPEQSRWAADADASAVIFGESWIE